MLVASEKSADKLVTLSPAIGALPLKMVIDELTGVVLGVFF